MKVTIAEKVKNSMIDTLFGIMAEGSGSLLITVGAMISFCAVMNITCQMEVILLTAGAGVLFGVLVDRQKHGMWLGVAGMVIGVMALLLMKDYVINGALVLYNAIGETLGKRSSILLSTYELLSETTSLRDMELVIGIFSAFCGCMNYVLLKTGRFLVMVLWIPAALYSVCSDYNTNLYGKIMVLAGVILCTLCFSFIGKKKGKMERGYQMVLLSGAFLFLLAAGGVWVTDFIFPVDEYNQDAVFVELREEILDWVEEVRYGKVDLNTLPKGNLEKAETWEGTEETALKVTMDQPESLYLRGFVGSIYESNQWRELEYSDYYDAKDLFYWLHQGGFAGDTQVALVRSLLTETELTQKEISVKVENVGADREYVYAPYELIGLEAAVEENQGDSCHKSTEFFGTDDYTFTTYGNLMKDFPQMAAESYLYKAANMEDDYVAEESHYNAFVYEHYTDIPAELSVLFKQELGYAGNADEGHANYYSVIEKIRTYLENQLTYGNYGEELPEGKDFVNYFLTESKIGNPVHYATAATMMFRYYGIPARYVEGYLITPDQVEGMEGETTIEIPGSNGHAWTEVYIDGLGWVPVEMTPEYYEVMDAPDFTKGLEADSTIVMQEPEQEEEEPNVNSAGDLKQKLIGFFIDLGKILLSILIMIDVFCILFFLYSLIRRGIANLKRKKAFQNKDNRLAVQSMTGYMTRLVTLGDGIFEVEEMDSYRAAYQIGEKAAFSLHDISDEEREQVRNCKDGLLHTFKKKKGWYEKWVLKYIEKLF